MQSVKDLIQEKHNLEKQVYMQGDKIIIDVCYKYPIDVAECGTHERLLGWAHHLCEKNWMSPPVLRRFMALAARHHGLELR